MRRYTSGALTKPGSSEGAHQPSASGSTFEAYWTPTLASAHIVKLRYGGLLLEGAGVGGIAGWGVEVLPGAVDAATCEVTGTGLDSSAVAGVTLRVNVAGAHTGPLFSST